MTAGAQLGWKVPSPVIMASPDEAMARAGQLAQQLTPQPVQAASTSAPQTPIRPPASSATQLPGQSATGPPLGRSPVQTSSLAARQSNLSAASTGVWAPGQALTSPAPLTSLQGYGGTLVQTQFSGQTNPQTSGQSFQRAASSAAQAPIQTGASDPAQIHLSQSGPSAAGQHSQLNGLATTVMADVHPAASSGQSAAMRPLVYTTSSNASPHGIKLPMPQSPLHTPGLANKSPAPALTAAALDQAAEAPGQRAAQAAPSMEKTTRQTDARDTGHDKATADDSDKSSEVKPSNEVLQPSDQTLGTGQFGQLSQESQQAKSPFKSVLRSPLHHDKAWEDTDDDVDDDGGEGTGEPNEMDWERHITASANPEPAGDRAAPAEMGHQGAVVHHSCAC